MKNLLIPFLLLILAGSVQAQEYCMATPIGYGAGATGGGNVAPVVVTTYADLKSNLESSNAKVIIVSGEITIPSNGVISAKSNKTMLGLSGAKLVSTNQTANGSGILSFAGGSSNVIIRNLIFEGPGAYDVDGRDLVTNQSCTKLWVDHCEFYDGVDGNFDNTLQADNITISWCKFGYNKPPKAGGLETDDHRFTNLVGASDTSYPSDGRYSITFAFNYWANGCKDRMPRARNAQLHVLNNYYNAMTNSTGVNLTAGTQGTVCYVEGNHFKTIGTPAKIATGNIGIKFVNNTGKATIADSGTTPAPTYEYTAIPASEVEAVVSGECGAGATLVVTEDGSISSPCGGGISPENPQLATPANVQAVSADNAINITWDEVSNATGYTVKLCKENPLTARKIWDFTGNWGLTAADADANLVKDATLERFNYNAAATAADGQLKFANGATIPFLADLRFVATKAAQATSARIRLGYGTGLLYFNGTNIRITIPCQAGEKMIVIGPASNSEARDRGYTITGGTLVADECVNVDAGGVMNVAGADGTWVITATSTAVALTTKVGGMNVKKILVGVQGEPLTCNEYEVSTNSFTKDGLTEDDVYHYQVLATTDAPNPDSDYSDSQQITVSSAAGTADLEADGIIIVSENGVLTVQGAEIAELRLFGMDGRTKTRAVNTQVLNVTGFESGFYVLSIHTRSGAVLNQKIVVK